MSNNEVNTETKILEAAANEFMTKGYAGARTTAIAEAAGVTHGMLHYYFRTKEKLFERIISDKVELLASTLSESMQSADSDIYELLKKITYSHLNFFAENPLLPGFIIREAYAQPELKELFVQKLANHLPKMFIHLQNVIDKNADEGKCKRIDAKQLMIDMACINVFPFMAAPLMSSLIPAMNIITPEFLEARKQQNYETLASKLRL
ncbi:MAG: TetR/AcrR family transcriptional regulator [Muribaculaceae bacterium]|nr:TetR/AcrR family transcriptional regulator [Muribaculaceae bacterium]